MKLIFDILVGLTRLFFTIVLSLLSLIPLGIRIAGALAGSLFGLLGKAGPSQRRAGHLRGTDAKLPSSGREHSLLEQSESGHRLNYEVRPLPPP
ncbi:hypothetical protein [Mesorhizobium sp. M0589]|uniref:hypothetical protein n=1 Tax=Mesorhizobium sp. M0589 TaxID=2956965 RepID=UPI00333C1F9E